MEHGKDNCTNTQFLSDAITTQADMSRGDGSQRVVYIIKYVYRTGNRKNIDFRCVYQPDCELLSRSRFPNSKRQGGGGGGGLASQFGI
jgi:hypothetical protein